MTFFERRWVEGNTTQYTDKELPVDCMLSIGTGGRGHTPNRVLTETVFHVLSPDNIQVATFVSGHAPGVALRRRVIQGAAMNRSRLHTAEGRRVVWKPTSKG